MARQRRRKRGILRVMGRSPTGDLTPSVGAETDIAPLGRAAVKPAHERTADEDRDVADWDRVAATEEFRALVAEKVRFIVPATAGGIAARNLLIRVGAAFSRPDARAAA